jgi:microcystin-dependent protein
MAQPFLSEIRIMSFIFPPKGWGLCNGQLLPINQNQALFALLGTTYGGNGQTTFGLPDLRGRVPTHMGSGLSLGERGGSESVTIDQQTTPTHFHVVQGVQEDGDIQNPSGAFLATAGAQPYHGATNLAAMEASSVSSIGGSQAHTNLQPFLVLSFCIALQGIFPSQN